MARLAESAYERLRGQILTGDLVHGERLAEEEIAENLGISRTPVREALRRLAAEGLVDVAPNRGASVARWESADLLEIFDLRAVLESYAAKRAASRAGPEEVARLTDACQEMEDIYANFTGDRALRSLTEHNRRFHKTIIECAQSPRLGSMIDSLTHVPVVLQTFAQYSPHALARSLQHHREIVDAIRAGDATWAGSVMSAHVLAARHEVLGSEGDKKG
jgi:DNA-binding GntR family transcriptional regulator